jgi:hypothetical protein
LGGEETPKEEKKVTETKAEAKETKPVDNTPAAKIKAEAIAKFPKDIVAQTKYILEHSPQINFLVPLGENEAPGTIEEPQINGYKTKVPKGIMVTIPIQVANLLAEKYKIAMSAGADKRIDRASDVSEALG